MTDDGHHGVWWHKVIGVAAVGLATSIGGAVTSHFGAPTRAQLNAVDEKVTALAAKQRISDDVNARNHIEDKEQIGGLGTKIDKLSAVVLGRKKKRSNAEP